MIRSACRESNVLARTCAKSLFHQTSGRMPNNAILGWRSKVEQRCPQERRTEGGGRLNFSNTLVVPSNHSLANLFLQAKWLNGLPGENCSNISKYCEHIVIMKKKKWACAPRQSMIKNNYYGQLMKHERDTHTRTYPNTQNHKTNDKH